MQDAIERLKLSDEDSYALQLLADLCGIYSPSYEERAAVELMVQKAAARGLRAAVDEAGNFIAETGGGARTLLFLGHIDTVPGFIPVRLVDGNLYGRGTVDAKGPLAAFFAAATRVRALRSLRLVIAGAVEEEAPTSRGARHILQTYRPDFVIVGEPSGGAGITLGYKGRVTLRCRISKPHEHTAGAGRSVAARAVDFWNTVEGYCQRFNDGKTGFERIDAHLAGVNTASDGFTDTADLQASFRLPIGFDVANLEHSLRGSAAVEGAELSMDGLVTPFRASKRTPLVRAFLQAIRAEGLEPAFKLKTGTSDMNIVGPVWNCPILAYGPGDSTLDHTPQEHVVIDEYLAAVRILVMVLELLDATGE